MKELKQYHFDRDYFTSVFEEIFANRCFDLEVACQEHRETENFLLYYKDDGLCLIAVGLLMIAWEIWFCFHDKEDKKLS